MLQNKPVFLKKRGRLPSVRTQRGWGGLPAWVHTEGCLDICSIVARQCKGYCRRSSEKREQSGAVRPFPIIFARWNAWCAWSMPFPGAL